MKKDVFVCITCLLSLTISESWIFPQIGSTAVLEVHINIPPQNYPSVVENPFRPMEKYSAKKMSRLITNPSGSRSNHNHSTKRNTRSKEQKESCKQNSVKCV